MNHLKSIGYLTCIAGISGFSPEISAKASSPNMVLIHSNDSVFRNFYSPASVSHPGRASVSIGRITRKK